jgi:hypothetical protein
LRRFASQLGFEDLANDVDITIVPIGGFSQRQKIQNAAWTFEKVLKADIAISALLDRDYRCVEEVEELVRETRGSIPNFHILAGKEIENYLLVPSAIMRAILERLKEQKRAAAFSQTMLEDMIVPIVNGMKSAVLSQHISNRMRYFDHRTSKDPATVAAEAISYVDTQWHDDTRRLLIAPGKQVLSAINKRLQETLRISITCPQIIRNLKSEEIATDLSKILFDLNNFAKGQRILGRSAA